MKKKKRLTRSKYYGMHHTGYGLVIEEHSLAVCVLTLRPFSHHPLLQSRIYLLLSVAKMFATRTQPK